MPWNHKNEALSTPVYDTAPLGFLALNTLKLLNDFQDQFITYWNTRWSELNHYTLQRLPRSSMKIGKPKSNNAHNLHLIIKGTVKEDANSELIKATFVLLYLTGNVQLEGEMAAEHGDVIVSSFYLELWMSILQAAPCSKFTMGWPTGDREPVTAKFFNIIDPDSAAFPDLESSLGVQMALTMDLMISPISINRTSTPTKVILD